MYPYFAHRLTRQTEEKENDLKAQGKGSGAGGKMGKKDLKKYGAVVREKIEKYKKMREELAALRQELVVLQRTEQILKSRHKNLDEFLADLERQKGVEVSVFSASAFDAAIRRFANFYCIFLQNLTCIVSASHTPPRRATAPRRRRSWT